MKPCRPIPFICILFVAALLIPASAFADCSEKLLNRLLDSGFSKAEILDLCGEKAVPSTPRLDSRRSSGAAACRGLNMVKEQILRAQEDCREYNEERWDEWEGERRKHKGTRDPWRMPPMDLSCGNYTTGLERIEEKIAEFCR